jgi:RNA polymerase sigma factor (sigma-70 family)
MDALTDALIIAGSMDEPALFTQIFDRHFDAVRGYLGRRVDADVAQDLAAEAFTVAFDGRRRFDSGRPSARPWLLGIATNLLRHHRRSEVRRLHAMARLDVPDLIPDGTDSIDARLDAGRLRSRLADALASLPQGERDVLLLHAWADLDHAAIAQALGISVGTARSRLHRARGRLRERLAQTGRPPLIGSPHEVTP